MSKNGVDEDREPEEGGFAHPAEGEQEQSFESEETLSDDELGSDSRTTDS